MPGGIRTRGLWINGKPCLSARLADGRGVGEARSGALTTELRAFRCNASRLGWPTGVEPVPSDPQSDALPLSYGHHVPLPALGRRERSAPATRGRVCPPGRGFTPRRPGPSLSASLVSVHRPPFPLDAEKESPRPASCAGGATCIAPLVRNRAPTAHRLPSPRRRTCRPAGPARFPIQYPNCPALPSPPNDDRRSSDWRTTLPAPVRPGGPQGGCSWAGRKTWSSRLRSPVHGGFCSTGQHQKKSRVLMPPVHSTVVRGPALRTAKRPGDHRDATPKAGESKRPSSGCQPPS